MTIPHYWIMCRGVTHMKPLLSTVILVISKIEENIEIFNRGRNESE